MRLRWGPHAGETAEQVVLRDPLYIVQILSAHGEGALAGRLRDLVAVFDALPVLEPCARCAGSSDGLCAYPGSIALFGFCESCVLVSARAAPRPAHRLAGYEDAVRHVALSFRRAHRINMRRIVGAMAVAKGAPSRITEAAASDFLQLRSSRPAAGMAPTTSKKTLGESCRPFLRPVSGERSPATTAEVARLQAR